MALQYDTFKLIADCVFPCIGVAGCIGNAFVLIGLSNAAISRATKILIAAQVCNNFVVLFCDTVYSPLAINGLAESGNATGHVIPGFVIMFGVHCGESILLAMAVQRWIVISQLLEGPGTFETVASAVCVAACVIYGIVCGIPALFQGCIVEMSPGQGDWTFVGESGQKEALGHFIIDWIFIGFIAVIYVLIGVRLLVHRKKRNDFAASGKAGTHRVSIANQQREQQAFKRELRVLLQFSLICCGWLVHLSVFVLITVLAGNEKFDLLLASLFAKITRCLLTIFEPTIYILFMKGLFRSVLQNLCPCLKVLNNTEHGNKYGQPQQILFDICIQKAIHERSRAKLITNPFG